MTKSEKWKKRAWIKYKMMGFYRFNSSIGVITESEKEMLNQIESLRKSFLTSFDDRSRELGFNVAEHRCWCGKVAIHKPDYEVYHEDGNGLVCKKHIKRE